MQLTLVHAPKRTVRDRAGFFRVLERLDADLPLLCGCGDGHGDGRECPGD